MLHQVNGDRYGITNNIQDCVKKGGKHYILYENSRPHVEIRENNQKKAKTKWSSKINSIDRRYL
jgi:hypothetical protein